MHDDDELVNLPVPKRFLLKAMAYVGSLEEAEASPLPISSPALGKWTPELIARSVKQSAEPMRSALVSLAEAGDTGVTTQELADELKLEKGRAAVAGMFGAFGRRCASRYKTSADDLYERSYEFTGSEGEYDTRLVMVEWARATVLEASNA